MIAALALVLYFSRTAPTQVGIPYSQMVSLFENEQVTSFVVKDNTVTMNLRAPLDGQSSVHHDLNNFSVFYYDLGELIQQQYHDGILTDYDYPKSSETPWWLTFVPYLLLGAVFLLVWFVMMNRSAGGGGNVMKFSKAHARLGADAEGKKVTFDDVAGADEEKAELQEIVEFLRNPQKFTQIGARIPKGVLLVGPPGTGKTLLAKAVAGESGVQFLSISGSDFVELYVGVGASRVRDLFEQAKKIAPSIIFIDEIDAVGRKRGAGLGGGHDEREQTLNQLLVEMDGFGSNEGVIVMAATNRKDILDSALLRPGRFDRQIYVGAPDAKGREAVLRVHARNIPLSDDVNLRVVAGATTGFTGADLANLLNESALLAARHSRPVVAMADLEEAMLKVIAGPEKRSHVVSKHERRLTAIHEAGHAVVMHALPTHDPVHAITIVPRGGAGGMTISLPEEDHSFLSRNEMFEQIVALLGGRVSEALFLDDISTGASNDIDRASAIAREMVTRYGMSEAIGAISYGSSGEVFIGRDYEKTKSYSEKTAGSLDDEVKRLVGAAYDRCTVILKENAAQLLGVADFLEAHDAMDRGQFEAVMRGENPALAAPVSLFGAENVPDAALPDASNAPKNEEEN
ncbi:MAG: ATP-dependent zinc metalloprotease FtsH [Oscillospiraceae bacterium]|nr:ATP-dependent zinc metalloprotease FtsH [Oscillospiraceae bacterium]